jgi:hypothetical protein
VTVRLRSVETSSCVVAFHVKMEGGVEVSKRSDVNRSSATFRENNDRLYATVWYTCLPFRLHSRTAIDFAASVVYFLMGIATSPSAWRAPVSTDSEGSSIGFLGVSSSSDESRIAAGRSAGPGVDLGGELEGPPADRVRRGRDGSIRK